MKEEWRKVNGYDYSVSNLGRVFNSKTKKYLKLSRRPDGYLVCRLSKNGDSKVVKVHRIVYDAFNEIFDSTQVYHINGNLSDNKLENLSTWKRSEHQQLKNLGQWNRGEVMVLMDLFDEINETSDAEARDTCFDMIICLLNRKRYEQDIRK